MAVSEAQKSHAIAHQNADAGLILKAKMSLEILDKVDADWWDQEVIRLNGCCFHSYRWSIYSSTINKAKPVYFRLNKADGTASGLWNGLFTEKNAAGINLFKSLSFGSLPACEDPAMVRKMLENVLNFASKNRIISIQVNSYGTPVGSEVLEDFGFQIQKRWEFIISISCSKENLWNKIHSMKKRHINRGQKNGLRVEKSKTIDSVMTFRDLTAETAKRKLAAGISFPETGDRNYFELLKTMLIDTGIGRLYLTYDGCVPIAGAFIVGYNRTAYYLLSSTSEDGQRKGAQDLNIWTAITEFMNEGYKFFYLGGLSQTELVDQQLEKSGLYLFKKRFAAEIYPCYKGSLILRPAHRQIYEFIRKTKEVFVK